MEDECGKKVHLALCDVCRKLEVKELSERVQTVAFGEPVVLSLFRMVFLSCQAFARRRGYLL